MSGTPPRRGIKGQEIVVVGWSVRWMHIEQGAVNCDAGGGGGGGEGGGCRKWISRDRSRKGEAEGRHNTARLNLDSRAGIWGLTLVRLHRQASKPYLEIATTPLDILPLEGEPGQTVGQVHRD